MTIETSLVPGTLGRALGAFCAASLLAGGCVDDPEQVKIPTDNSGVVDGRAFVKFCHQITNGGQKVDLTLEFGNPVLGQITAKTGSCSPPLNLPCAPMAAGRLPARLLQGTNVLYTGGVGLAPDTEYLLTVLSNGQFVFPSISGVFQAGQCKSYDPFADGSVPDGGASDAGAADATADGPDATVDADNDAPVDAPGG
jgi:hypothetical protein